jgi:hypothetical protein
MSPLDPEVPPAGEEVHLPGPSILPVLTGVGITLTLVGITTFIELTIIGAILTISRSTSTSTADPSPRCGRVWRARASTRKRQCP